MNNESRLRALRATKALLKLPPERARKVIADEKARREKIRQQEASQKAGWLPTRSLRRTAQSSQAQVHQ